MKVRHRPRFRRPPIEIEGVVEKIAAATAEIFDGQDMLVSNNGRRITITQFDGRDGVRRRFHITIEEEA